MPRTEDTLYTLQQIFSVIQSHEEKLRELQNGPDAGGVLARLVEEMEEAIQKYSERAGSALEQLLRYPPRFTGHDLKLAEFYDDTRALGNLAPEDDPYERSVFIMTKFPPDPIPAGDTLGKELQQIIDSVVAGIKARGYVPRIASDKLYHPHLWQNVELYLLACARGVAIVEARYDDQLNPNVALEWGWMVGMGRRVLYLRDSAFAAERADWAGLVHHQFDWADPAPGVEAGLQALLE